MDDSKVTDHHAIVPTNKKSSDDLPPDEAKVYDLVARRFLAVFFPAARFENTTVVTEVREETFLSRGRVVLEAGWRALYPDGVGGRKEKEPPVLPPIEVGQEWAVAKVGVKEGETKPPPRYSESALLGAMETAGKLVEDEELRQQMKDSGLGTPATRAATIERLIKVGYIEREKKDPRPHRERKVPHRAPRGEPAHLRRAHGPLGGASREDGEGRGAPPRLHVRHKRLHHKARRRGPRHGGREACRSLPQPRAARRLPQVWRSRHRDQESLRLLGVEEDRVATS